MTLGGHPVVWTDQSQGKFVRQGYKLSEPRGFERINLTPYNNDTVSLNWQTDGKKVDLLNGSLKGYLDMINGRGVNAHLMNEVVVDGVRYYKDKLDAFACTLANVVNSIMPKNPDDPLDAGTYGKYREFLSSSDGGPITAANICISDRWTNDKSYFIYEDGNMMNKYCSQMIYDLTEGSFTFRGTDELGDGLFTGTFMDFVQDYITAQGSQTAFHNERLTATNEIALNILNQRDSISGVNQDEETVSMMAYQRMLQACSRMMTTMDEALDVIINKTGVVGR